MRLQRFNVSVTETGQYRRLVKFLQTVDQVACRDGNDELQGIVARCRMDLLELHGQPEPEAG